jgi:hypothetical protein
MEPVKKTFDFAFEVLPTLGDFVRITLLRDLPGLALLSRKYKGDTFLTTYDARLQAVKDLVAPAAFTAQHTRLTEQIDLDAKLLRPLLNNFDIRLLDAHREGLEKPAGPQLFVPVADFGLKPLRDAINIPKAIANAGRDLLYNIRQSQAILDAVEHPAEATAQIEALLATLATANAQRSKLITDRDLTVEANMNVLNDFYENHLAVVLHDGKKAYKEVSEAKTNDYTLRKLLQQITPKRPKKAKPTP